MNYPYPEIRAAMLSIMSNFTWCWSSDNLICCPSCHEQLCRLDSSSFWLLSLLWCAESCFLASFFSYPLVLCCLHELQESLFPFLFCFSLSCFFMLGGLLFGKAIFVSFPLRFLSVFFSGLLPISLSFFNTILPLSKKKKKKTTWFVVSWNQITREKSSNNLFFLYTSNRNKISV